MQHSGVLIGPWVNVHENMGMGSMVEVTVDEKQLEWGKRVKQ